MHLTTPPTTKRCRTCHQYEPSRLERHGYCKAARTVELKARLLPDDTVCLFLTEWSAKP